MIFGNFLADETYMRVFENFEDFGWMRLMYFACHRDMKHWILKSCSTEMAEGIHESHE